MTQITNKLERQQLNKKHAITHKHFNGWTNFNTAGSKPVSYRTKVEKAERDLQNLMKEEWK